MNLDGDWRQFRLSIENVAYGEDVSSARLLVLVGHNLSVFGVQVNVHLKK
jgi:hypothetical protein